MPGRTHLPDTAVPLVQPVGATALLSLLTHCVFGSGNTHLCVLDLLPHVNHTSKNKIEFNLGMNAMMHVPVWWVTTVHTCVAVLLP